MIHFQSRVIQVKSYGLCSDFSLFFLFFMLHFIYFIGFPTTEGEEFCCRSSISSAVKRKIAHFVNKVSNFEQTFLT